MLKGQLPDNWESDLPSYSPVDKGLATENIHKYVGRTRSNLPELIGGSADLTHSNYTDIKGETGSFNLIALKKIFTFLGYESMQWQPYLMVLSIVVYTYERNLLVLLIT